MMRNFIWETSTAVSGPLHQIDLWTVPLTVARSASALSDEEAARAARFRFEKDRFHWTNARSALRAILAMYAGEPPESLRFVFNENGKPSLDGHAIEFNLSHAGDYALIGVSETAPVGVDIERIRPGVDIASLLERLGETDLPESIPDLYHRWTQREARSKAAGGQLFSPPPAAIQATDIAAPEGYAASVATARFPARLTLRDL